MQNVFKSVLNIQNGLNVFLNCIKTLMPRKGPPGIWAISCGAYLMQDSLQFYNNTLLAVGGFRFGIFPCIENHVIAMLIGNNGGVLRTTQCFNNYKTHGIFFKNPCCQMFANHCPANSACSCCILSLQYFTTPFSLKMMLSSSIPMLACRNEYSVICTFP